MNMKKKTQGFPLAVISVKLKKSILEKKWKLLIRGHGSNTS